MHAWDARYSCGNLRSVLSANPLFPFNVAHYLKYLSSLRMYSLDWYFFSAKNNDTYIIALIVLFFA